MGNTCRRKNRSWRNVPAHDLVLEVAVGRRHDADVDLRGSTPPSRARRAVLQHAQQLRLHRHRQLADLVQEQRAAVGDLEPSASPGIAPVYAPFSWPNSSLSISGPGQRRAIDTDQQPVPSFTALMHGSARSSLPVPVSPDNMHRGIGGGHAPDLAQHRFHCRALRNDRVVARLDRELLAQGTVVELEPFFELRDLRIGALQREIRPLAPERVRENMRHNRKAILQDIRPLALVSQRAECERTQDGTSRDQREEQVRLWGVCPERWRY